MKNVNFIKTKHYTANIQMSLNSKIDTKIHIDSMKEIIEISTSSTNETMKILMQKYVLDTTTEIRDRKLILTEIIDRKCSSTDLEVKNLVKVDDVKTSLIILDKKLVLTVADRKGK